MKQMVLIRLNIRVINLLITTGTYLCYIYVPDHNREVYLLYKKHTANRSWKMDKIGLRNISLRSLNLKSRSILVTGYRIIYVVGKL